MVDTDKLRMMRCSKKFFTATSFARALGMRPANYRNRERGSVPFTADEVVKVCELLGITLEDGITFLT